MENKLSKITHLNNGEKMPTMGFGTYKLENVVENIKIAFEAGYRSFDTAKLYNNEAEIGTAINELIKEGKANREDFFITTKIWQSEHKDPINAIKSALNRFNLKYIDLYLIHWPLPHVEDGKIISKTSIRELWTNLEECVTQGLTKSIGVCNFNVQLLFDLLSYCKIKPVCNQVEINPLNSQNDLVDFCKKFDIAITAYNPLSQGASTRIQEGFNQHDLFKNEIILSLAEKYKKKPAQIILNWHIYKGITVIPKSNNKIRQIENIESFNFEMEKSDYEKIESININKRWTYSLKKEFSGGIEVFA